MFLYDTMFERFTDKYIQKHDILFNTFGIQINTDCLDRPTAVGFSDLSKCLNKHR